MDNPIAPAIRESTTNTAKVRVNLKILLNAPSGQMYLHQNILINRLPRKSRSMEITVIQAVISPLNPVAMA